MNLKNLLLVACLLPLGLAGCSSTGDNSTQNDSEQIGNLVLAYPQVANFRTQVAVARLNRVLAEVEQINNDQRAQLLYQRGSYYDGLGLRVLANIDFDTALKLKPDMAEAHNFMGIHHTQNGNFVEAYNSFDSTLEIQPDHDFALLNRGIALYYGGRPELAAKDLKRFYDKDQADPYRALWFYMIEKENNQEEASAFLQEARTRMDDGNWATLIVDFYLGKITETELLDDMVIGVTSTEELTDRLCEVYFYLGKYHSSKNEIGKATSYFKLTLSTNVYQYVEHRYARLELNLLRDSEIN